MLYRALTMALFASIPLAAAAAAPAAPAAATAPAPSTLPPLPPPDAAATEIANRFTAVLKCEPGKKDVGRHLCGLTRIGKDPVWTPGQASSYLGVSLKVKTGADLKKIGAEPLTVAALHLAAGSARVVPLRGIGEAAALTTDLQNLLRGDKKDALAVPPELASRLHDERIKARNPLSLDKLFAEFAGPAPTRLYRAELASSRAWPLARARCSSRSRPLAMASSCRSSRNIPSKVRAPGRAGTGRPGPAPPPVFSRPSRRPIALQSDEHALLDFCHAAGVLRGPLCTRPRTREPSGCSICCAPARRAATDSRLPSCASSSANTGAPSQRRASAPTSATSPPCSRWASRCAMSPPKTPPMRRPRAAILSTARISLAGGQPDRRRGCGAGLDRGGGPPPVGFPLPPRGGAGGAQADVRFVRPAF